MSTITAMPARPLSAMHDEPLTGLVRTCESACAPMWVRDPSGGYLYRNPAARACVQRPPTAEYEILDHRGRTLARLSVGHSS